MNDRGRNRCEPCKRAAQFGKDYKAQIPSGSMLETATEEALLINFMAPATWKTDFADGAAAFDAAFSTAEIKQKVNEAMQLKRTIGFVIPNVFAGEPATIAAWHSAAHVEDSPKKKSPTSYVIANKVIA